MSHEERGEEGAVCCALSVWLAGWLAGCGSACLCPPLLVAFRFWLPRCLAVSLPPLGCVYRY